MSNHYTEKVLQEIHRERMRQKEEAKFSPEHDSRHPLPFWIALVTRHAGMGVQDGGLTNRGIFRRQMIRAAAVAAAAVEALDRHMASLEEDHPVEAEKPDEYARLKEVAQSLANETHEPALVIPAGSETSVMGTSINFPFVTLLSQAEKRDVSRAVFRAEPQ